MITTPTQSDLDYLYKLQDSNRQTRVFSSILTPTRVSKHEFETGIYYTKKDGKYYAASSWDEDQLYYREPIYNIDLNSRTIETPKYLSVKYDHNAETIYFAVDRYFDNVDLSNVFCAIQYQNANPDTSQNGFIYYVEYIDITSLADENKMLIPWVIEGHATAFSGPITFSIKFYEIDVDTVDQVSGPPKKKKFYKYLLNTQPAKSNILHGMDFKLAEDYNPTEALSALNVFDNVYQALAQVARQSDLYWIVIDDSGELNDPNVDRTTIVIPTSPSDQVSE